MYFENKKNTSDIKQQRNIEYNDNYTMNNLNQEM